MWMILALGLFLLSAICSFIVIFHAIRALVRTVILLCLRDRLERDGVLELKCEKTAVLKPQKSPPALLFDLTAKESKKAVEKFAKVLKFTRKP